MTLTKQNTFATATDTHLNALSGQFLYHNNNNFSTSLAALNHRWALLKKVIKESSKNAIKHKTIGLNTKEDTRSQLLLDLYSDSRYVSRILRRVIDVRYNPSSIDPQEWIAIRNKIIDIANNRNFALSPIVTPSFILGRANYHRFKTKLIKLKNHLNKLCSVQESSHTDKQIRY